MADLRKILAGLVPEMAEKTQKLIEACAKKGVELLVYCGRRTLANYTKHHGLKTVQLPGGTRYRVRDVLEFERRRWRA